MTSSPLGCQAETFVQPIVFTHRLSVSEPLATPPTRLHQYSETYRADLFMAKRDCARLAVMDSLEGLSSPELYVLSGNSGIQDVTPGRSHVSTPLLL